MGSRSRLRAIIPARLLTERGRHPTHLLAVVGSRSRLRTAEPTCFLAERRGGSADLSAVRRSRTVARAVIPVLTKDLSQREGDFKRGLKKQRVHLTAVDSDGFVVASRALDGQLIARARAELCGHRARVFVIELHVDHL